MGTILGNGIITFGDSTVQSTAGVVFGSGTAILFQQTAAPTGWTKSTTHNDKALRVVSGTVSSGGTAAFSTANITSSGSISVGVSAGTLAVGIGTLAVGIGTLAGAAATLAESQIPSHTHPIELFSGSGAFPATPVPRRFSTGVTNLNVPAPAYPTNAAGGNGAHSHGISGSPSISGTPTLSGSPSITSTTFTGNATNLSLQYVDVIIATKN